MNKYLVVVGNYSGQWTSGDLTQAYVFEADDDKAAVIVMASYLKGSNDYAIEFLGRITGGLQVQKVHVPDEVRDSDIAELSHERQQEIGFDHLFIGQSMISQLQPFDPKVRKDRLAAINKRSKKKDQSDRAKVAAMPLPKVGDDIYVPSALYVYHGRDDVVGGLARVKSVSKQTNDGERVHFISVKEISGGFNWEQYLALMQAELKKEFGKNRAYPDPDDSPEFNEP